MKKTFHIIWEIQAIPQLTTGENFEAYCMTHAFYEFKKKYPSLDPLAIFDKSQMKDGK